MLLANKEAVMTVLNTLNFVAFNPFQNNNSRQLVINPRVEVTPFLYIGNRSRNFIPYSDFN